uniref:Uncharacterized protein n=1 Tax=Ditylenchus dipsaci TaxID=166011 RepID=A0A915EMW5_9BILA
MNNDCSSMIVSYYCAYAEALFHTGDPNAESETMPRSSAVIWKATQEELASRGREIHQKLALRKKMKNLLSHGGEVGYNKLSC